MFDITLEDLK